MSIPEVLSKSHDKNIIWEEPGRRIRQCKYGPMIYPDQDFYVGGSLDTYGEYIDAEFQIFKHFVKPTHIVLDVGANLGAHTIPLAQLVTNQGRVIAFEPQRYMQSFLQANIALNGLHNVISMYMGLGDKVETIKVPYMASNKTINLGSIGKQHWTKGDAVPCQTLDNFNLNQCNFIKLDVEGMELEFLNGAKNTINKCRPVMFVEDDRKDLSPQLRKMLHSMQYNLFLVHTYLFNENNFFQFKKDIYLQQNNKGENVKTICTNLICIPRESNETCPNNINGANITPIKQ